eukprot:9232134-Pyramimonas_sp.AAC.2
MRRPSHTKTAQLPYCPCQVQCGIQQSKGGSTSSHSGGIGPRAPGSCSEHRPAHRREPQQE